MTIRRPIVSMLMTGMGIVICSIFLVSERNFNWVLDAPGLLAIVVLCLDLIWSITTPLVKLEGVVLEYKKNFFKMWVYDITKVDEIILGPNNSEMFLDGKHILLQNCNVSQVNRLVNRIKLIRATTL